MKRMCITHIPNGNSKMIIWEITDQDYDLLRIYHKTEKKHPS